MKSYKTWLIEMAPPNDNIKSKLYYHGTDKQKSYEGIVKDGFIRPPDLVGSEGYLTPVKGKVYITPKLRYAIIYTIGGDILASDTGKYKEDDRYGYLFVINGNELKDIQPDEDSVGEMIYKKELDWLNDLAERKLSREYMTYWDEDEDGNETESEEPLLRLVYDGDYNSWAHSGKLLMRYLSDAEKLELINHGAHVAHDGEIKYKEIWKFDKNLNKDLKKDGSNFFELAERIK